LLRSRPLVTHPSHLYSLTTQHPTYMPLKPEIERALGHQQPICSRSRIATLFWLSLLPLDITYLLFLCCISPHPTDRSPPGDVPDLLQLTTPGWPLDDEEDYDKEETIETMAGRPDETMTRRQGRQCCSDIQGHHSRSSGVQGTSDQPSSPHLCPSRWP
jgi:hypothetical protein